MKRQAWRSAAHDKPHYAAFSRMLERIEASILLSVSFGYQITQSKHFKAFNKKIIYFNALIPPYFFRAVRSFGEYGAERDEIRPHGQSDSQELFAKKPANTGAFRRWIFGERDWPKG
jgi:hypothetical protein